LNEFETVYKTAPLVGVLRTFKDKLKIAFVGGKDILWYFKEVDGDLGIGVSG